MITRIALNAIFGTLLFFPLISSAGEGEHAGHPLEAIAIETTPTPENDASLAQHYRSSAADARAMVRRHETMARSYSAAKLPQRQQMKRHCKNISDEYTKIAKDYDALAEYHEKAAAAAE